MSQKIVMSGYYGFQNAGDDAVCYAIIEALQKAMPECEITVLSNDTALTEKTYGVRAVNRWKIGQVAGALRTADLLVSGGGSLIQDVTSKNSCLYYLGVIVMARLLGTKVVVYGQGLGPLKNGRNKRLTKWIFNRVGAIYVRDEESHQLLLDIGVKQPIQVAPDPVLGIDSEVLDEKLGASIVSTLGYQGDRPLALVALRNWPGQNHVTAFAQMGDHLVKRGYAVGLLAMHVDQDDGLAQAVCEQMQEAAFCIRGTYDTPTLFSIYDQASLVVGMRLHALIIGAALDKSLMAISYDPKVDSFMRMIHDPHCVALGSVTGTLLCNKIDEALAADMHQAAHRMHALKRLSRNPAYHCQEILFNK